MCVLTVSFLVSKRYDATTGEPIGSPLVPAAADSLLAEALGICHACRCRYIYVCVCVCARMYACMYVCLNACMHACMHAFVDAYACVCVCVHRCWATFFWRKTSGLMTWL